MSNSGNSYYRNLRCVHMRVYVYVRIHAILNSYSPLCRIYLWNHCNFWMVKVNFVRSDGKKITTTTTTAWMWYRLLFIFPSWMLTTAKFYCFMREEFICLLVFFLASLLISSICRFHLNVQMRDRHAHFWCACVIPFRTIFIVLILMLMTGKLLIQQKYWMNMIQFNEQIVGVYIHTHI